MPQRQSAIINLKNRTIQVLCQGSEALHMNHGVQQPLSRKAFSLNVRSPPGKNLLPVQVH
jgi:hypothetical protein